MKLENRLQYVSIDKRSIQKHNGQIRGGIAGLIIFGCDYISYGLILLRFWVCVLMIMAREPVFRSVYYPGLFLGFVVLLIIILFCTFSRIYLFSFYLFLYASQENNSTNSVSHSFR
jgi:hypothetical protein